MLGLNYKNEEDLNKDIFSGKVQREILDYIKEIYEDRERHPDWYTIELNNENIYYLFDAEVGDKCIGYEMIYSPGTNKYANIFHDLIETVYEEFVQEKTLCKNNNYKEVMINSKMDPQELYVTLTSVTSFAKVEKGRYLDYIEKCGFDFKDSEIIYGACNLAYFKDDTGLSLDYIVYFTCQSIKDGKVKVNEIERMSSRNLNDAVINQNFEYYTILHYKDEVNSTLEDVLHSPNVDVIYNLKREDANQFVHFYEADKGSVPKIMIVSGNLAIDNSEGECFIEEFDCHEKALKWVEACSGSVEDIEKLFSTYEEELPAEDLELDL